MCSPAELLLAAAPAGASIQFAPLGWEAWLTAGLLAVMITALVLDLASPDQILLGGLALLLVLGIVEPRQALAGFAEPAVLAVGALFVVAAAVRRSGALNILRGLMKPRGPSKTRALTRIMLPASGLSALLNNTPVVAFLTPLVQQWSRGAGIPASKLLLPLSFATILGGTGTLIGTSTNLMASGLLEGRGGEPFAMFELCWVALPAALAGWLYFVSVGHRLLPSVDEEGPVSPFLAREYRFDLRVPSGSPLAGKTIEEAGLRRLEDAFLAHIRRRGGVIGPVGPAQALEEGDILTFSGNPEALERLLESGELSRVVEVPRGGDSNRLPRLPLYEAVVSPESSLVGQRLRDIDFRERFQAVVLGVHRRGKRLVGSVGTIPIETGDLLLIEARPGFESRWGLGGEFYLVAPLEREGLPERRHARSVLAIVIGLVVAVTAGWLPMVTAAIAAALLLVLTGSLAPNEARRAVDLSVLLVLASAFGFGQAIQTTGLDRWLGGAIGALAAGGLGTVGVLAVVYVATNLLTEVLTNSVAVVLIFPVGMRAAAEAGGDPRAFAVAMAVAASASFSTPIGYQTNLMVMGPGGYRFLDYLRVGLPLNALVFGISMLVIPRVWFP